MDGTPSSTLPDASDVLPTTKTATKTTIQNRRLTYLHRTTYLLDRGNQQRLFPHLYKSLIQRHESASEKLDAINLQKSRSLTHVLLDANDHMEKLQRQKARSLQQRKDDDDKLMRERDLMESLPRGVVVDREKSRAFLEGVMRDLFMRGGDEEFDYAEVDEKEEWDDWDRIEEDIRSRYFDEETEEEEVEQGKTLVGQTGVQDF
jgi:hypothetical protein